MAKNYEEMEKPRLLQEIKLLRGILARCRKLMYGLGLDLRQAMIAQKVVNLMQEENISMKDMD